MAVQGNRFELGQDRHAVDIGVDAVTDWDIDQAVFPSNGYRWFRTISD
jgi:hypothetical protein